MVRQAKIACSEPDMIEHASDPSTREIGHPGLYSEALSPEQN